MGSLFHLLDVNEDIMARKVAHKKHVGGLEAPRNSLELQMETSYGLYSARDNILYAHHMAKESSGKDYYFTESPMKKLISEEISKKSNTRQNAPSVVARLMGVDMLPFDSKPAPQVVDIKKENPSGKLMDKKLPKKSSVGHVLSTSNCSQQLEVGSLGHYVDRYPDQRNGHVKSNKPKPREHPQEEELQKFKKEFEAWQTARFKECADFVKVSSAPAQIIAQEDLNREKMYLYANSKRTTNIERCTKSTDLAELVDPHEMVTFGSCKKKNLSAEGKESLHSNRMSRTDCRSSQITNSDQKFDIHSVPSKIVILRPGPDRMDVYEDSWTSSPSTSGTRGGIEDFLEEVKERLKSELQGKCPKRSTTIRGGGIETPYWEKPTEPRQIARYIAQEVRDSVSRDLGMNLLRSESTRSYRSEFQLNGTGSPEFINRNTRRLLADRLRNVLKGERNPEVPIIVPNSSRLSMSDYEKSGDGQLRDTWIDNKISCPDNFTNELEKHSRSFRREPDEGAMHQKDLSPRNLIRSLSAPVSGTSFGKLLLEDRHILTGAQIRRKHEVIEKVSLNIKKQKKDKFNIREKVSSFRYSLTLRGRLFRRRVKSVDGSDQNKNLLRDIRSGPTVMMNFCETHENSTEVPPSPASVCSSSVQEEFWRQADYLSPISSSGGHQLEDSEMSHVFREINSNLNELRRKLDQLDGSVPEETIKEQQPTEVEVYIEDQTEAYIRDLLVAAGLYDGTFSQSLSKWDPLGKPISTQVFEEVEETYKENAKNDERCRKDQGEKVNHKLILDLLNEVLPAILREPANMSSNIMGKAIGPVHKPPCGRKLLSHVWNIIRAYVHPPADRSYYGLDDMLARDLMSTTWSRQMDDDVNALGRDIECLIIGDLIQEMVKDMYS
ncbi:hypothetical protein DH2020_013680 [Rehmannia glutinosa]|uniref:DUF4378 domain-containing protein n=1 Tax=Rehmannia glutinosa TaxID=99300 RepID=A0ABR0X330_REHGL